MDENKDRLHLFLARMWADELRSGGEEASFDLEALCAFFETDAGLPASLTRTIVAGLGAGLWELADRSKRVYRLLPVERTGRILYIDSVVRLLNEAIEYEPTETSWLREHDPHGRHRWYLEQIAEALSVELVEHEPGVAP